MVETINEVVDLVLLLTWTLQELNELSLALVEIVNYCLPLAFDVTNRHEAVLDIVSLHLFPNVDLVFARVINLFHLLDGKSSSR